MSAERRPALQSSLAERELTLLGVAQACDGQKTIMGLERVLFADQTRCLSSENGLATAHSHTQKRTAS